jgi:hypothetical protein
MRRASYKVPHRAGYAGTAAQFALHLHDRMQKDVGHWRQTRVSVAEAA